MATNYSILKIAYYFLSATYHYTLFATNIGNYFHGGSSSEWIAMEAMAVVCVVIAVRLFLKAKAVEKVFIVLCALIPAAGIMMPIFYSIHKLLN